MLRKVGGIWRRKNQSSEEGSEVGSGLAREWGWS